MHDARTKNKGWIDGIRLSNDLFRPTRRSIQAEVASLIAISSTTDDRLYEALPAAEEFPHRLAVVVDVIGVHGPALPTARLAMETGRTVSTSGEPNGYQFEEAGGPCGHLLSFSLLATDLDEKDYLFEAVTAHIYHTWVNARVQLRKQVDQADIHTQMIIAGPVPIAIALGWLMHNEHDVSVLYHVKPDLQSAGA